MKCPKCKHVFPANWKVDRAPGGQEAPGTFMFLGLIFASVGILLQFVVGRYWPYIFYVITGFVWLQMLVAWVDCRGTTCPKCGMKARVMPWSR